METLDTTKVPVANVFPLIIINNKKHNEQMEVVVSDSGKLKQRLDIFSVVLFA